VQFLPILALGVLMYLLLVRPQQKRVRDQRDLVRNVGVGARIQTIGGIVGEVVGTDDETIRVEVGPGVVITFVRAAVGRILEQAADDVPPDDLIEDRHHVDDQDGADGDEGDIDGHEEGPEAGPIGGVA